LSQLTVKSPAFEHNKAIPEKYTCKGENTNPPLTIGGIPQKTKSIALIMDDPDAPSGTFDHWVVWDIPPQTTTIAEHTAPGKEGVNSAQEHGYHGPCPPPGKPHRYFFKVYALDTQLGLGANSRKKDVEKAMQGHILAKGELIGLFRR